ncbi:UDP-2,3-diacylglucosamine diphosphatase [Faucicola boevrei]|uniref:UDP-2,3-diacylglucosamine diphosphatase n=1 Tax=Faucicola boevrei TaxID=346665 RepID=UPI00035D3603|nr:UDP-2,3-diacylglucosamine diphosphatase [Moraxella boevrei]
MQNFDDIIAYQPNDIQNILISDLHLSQNEPALTQAFLVFLDKIATLPQLSSLFILGDWFDAWLGDDIADTPNFANWLQPILAKLDNIRQNGCEIFVMHGNRDFLLGQGFCDKFGGKLLKQPFWIECNQQKIRLEHGDKLCTDDKSYQRFRRVIQNPLTKQFLTALPMTKREKIAQNLRQKSKSDNQKKLPFIMDVNENAVKNALKDFDVLIHGHTHRPFVHNYDDKKRVVLGDWRLFNNQVQAVIGIEQRHQQIELVDFTYQFF